MKEQSLFDRLHAAPFAVCFSSGIAFGIWFGGAARHWWRDEDATGMLLLVAVALFAKIVSLELILKDALRRLP